MIYIYKYNLSLQPYQTHQNPRLSFWEMLNLPGVASPSVSSNRYINSFCSVLLAGHLEILECSSLAGFRQCHWLNQPLRNIYAHKNWFIFPPIFGVKIQKKILELPPPSSHLQKTGPSCNTEPPKQMSRDVVPSSSFSWAAISSNSLMASSGGEKTRPWKQDDLKNSYVRREFWPALPLLVFLFRPWSQNSMTSMTIKKMDGGKFLRHFCETHNPNLHPTAKMKMSLFATAGIKWLKKTWWSVVTTSSKKFYLDLSAKHE